MEILGKLEKKYCAREIVYCDFCGNKLSYNVRYCRKCGRQLKDRSGDTQPIPVIDETILCNTTRGQVVGQVPWYKMIFKKKAPTNRSKVWSGMYYLASLAVIGALMYVLGTFQTIKEYQRLTAALGGLAAIYIWWKR